MNIYCCLTRQRELLKILIIKNHWTSSLELASALNIPASQVDMDVGVLNYVLEKYSSFIIFKKDKGYKLESNNINLLKSILFCNENKYTPFRNEIINKLMARLLASNYSLELFTLQKELSLSKADLEQYLDYIKEMLNNIYPSLELIKSYQCVSIMGSEFSIRYVLTELLMMDFNLETLHFSQENSLIKQQLFDSTFEKAVQIFNEENINIDHSVIATLATYLENTRLRVLSDNKISFLESKLQPGPDYYYDIATRLFESILPLPLCAREKCLEISQIALQISFIDLLQSSSGSSQRSADTTYGGIQALVDSLINTLKSELSLSLHSNKELYAYLTMHIKALINRMRYQQITPNLSVEAIRINYPFIPKLSTNIYEAFYRILNIKLSDSEVSYAAVHLANALAALEVE